MPWNLTSEISTGGLDSKNYKQVKIVEQRHQSNRKRFRLFLEYGNTEDGEWIPGRTPKGKKDVVTIRGQDFLDLLNANRELYEKVKKVFYDYLKAKGDIDDGTIV